MTTREEVWSALLRLGVADRVHEAFPGRGIQPSESPKWWAARVGATGFMVKPNLPEDATLEWLTEFLVAAINERLIDRKHEALQADIRELERKLQNQRSEHHNYVEVLKRQASESRDREHRQLGYASSMRSACGQAMGVLDTPDLRRRDRISEAMKILKEALHGTR